jgi:ribosomal protein L11 methyltransferase
MKWNEISIKTTEQGIDAVSALLYDLNVGGIEILGGELPKSGDWDYVDETLIEQYDVNGIIIRAYFPDDETFFDSFNGLRRGLKNLPVDGFDFGSLEILNEKREESEWAENWKKYFKPFKAGEKIVICPEWEEYRRKDDEIVLKIDPGMAFGSGLHETTKMCIKELEKHVSSTSKVIDVGCGSGILSIAAIKLGAGSALALDRDSVCVKVAKENAAYNGITDKIRSSKADLLSGVAFKDADIIAANIIADIIIRLNESVLSHLKQDGIYIMSGIIADRLDDVLASLSKHNFKILNISEMGEWRAVTATPSII